MTYEQAKALKVGESVAVKLDDGHKKVFQTCSKAWRLGDGTPVIKISGVIGCYSLERLIEVVK